MLKINSKVCAYNNYPLRNYYNDNKNNNTCSFTAEKKTVNLNHQASAINNMIAFKGYSPSSSKNRYWIKKIVNLIKSEGMKKIAIISHALTDGDAAGSEIALGRAIKTATGKNVDMFLMEPLEMKLAFIDENKEIKIIRDLFEDPKNPKAPIDPEKIRGKFGDYDLVIVTDTSRISLLDKELKEGIFDHAKKTVKIDHHPDKERLSSNGYNYANINLTDPNKESAAQIIMEFMRPLGIDTKKINPEISDAITMGLLTDTVQLTKARGQSIFKDVSELAKTSNISEIMKLTTQVTLKDSKIYADILNNIRTSKNGEVAYFITTQKEMDDPIKNIAMVALEQISKTKGVKYYFSIIDHESEPGKLCVSLRSQIKNKSIRRLAHFYGGGGHEHACAFAKKVENTEDFANELVNKLTELENS